jgi:AcrR family transcriptional regulator
VRYPREVVDSSFRRARSAENKRQRANELLEAARSVALDSGVASVTLTAVPHRGGVRRSAVRRYFSCHQEILLHLAAEGWTRWSETVCEALRTRAPVTASTVAELLASALDADPLFCDLLANVPLRLEHDVDVERVGEFKRISRAAVNSMADGIEKALPGIGTDGALDIVIAANAIAATLSQVAHPPEALARAYADDQTITPAWALDFARTLSRLLTATCVGLLEQQMNPATAKRLPSARSAMLHLCCQRRDCWGGSAAARRRVRCGKTPHLVGGDQDFLYSP